jgi:hypothetical protein
VKLSKIQRAIKVYRGMSRAALPATFWHPSEANCRGAVEVRPGGAAERRGVRGRGCGKAGGWEGLSVVC